MVSTVQHMSMHPFPDLLIDPLAQSLDASRHVAMLGTRQTSATHNILQSESGKTFWFLVSMARDTEQSIQSNRSFKTSREYVFLITDIRMHAGNCVNIPQH